MSDSNLIILSGAILVLSAWVAYMVGPKSLPLLFVAMFLTLMFLSTFPKGSG